MALRPSPIIVFGAPRSGTTYVQRILNRHPLVFVSHETRIFAWLHHAARVLTQKDQFVVTYRERFVEHLSATLPETVRDFYRSLAPDACLWGDKNPHYADPANAGCLETVEALFPGSRFVHVVRDGRDVVASLLRRRHPNGEPWVDFETAHYVWTEHVARGCAFGAGLPPAQYLQLRYEQLVEDDVQMACNLFDFLELELHPDVEEFCAAQAVERTPLSGPTRNLRAGAATSEWSSFFGPVERIRSLELLGPELVRHRYETDASLATLLHDAGQSGSGH